jgi:hypothetical protein
MSWTSHYFDPRLNRETVTRACTSQEEALRLACDLIRRNCRVYFIQGRTAKKYMRLQWPIGVKRIRQRTDVHR